MKALLALAAVAASVSVAPPAASAPTDAVAKWCPGVSKCPRPALTLREREIRADRRAHRRVFRFWSRQYVPFCTWLGESGQPRRGQGTGLQQFARWRYTVPNASGSGAYGKYQMMPGTYHAFARFHDWSRADQELAAHLLYRAQSSSPWQAC